MSETTARVWRTWLRQTRTVMGIDLRASFGRRSLVLYFLASIPVVLYALRGLLSQTRSIGHLPQDEVVFAVLFRTLVLRLVIFFGCVVIFTRLFRGEVLERSLHYYFLAPVRRDVLVAGKFLSGLAQAVVLFCFTTAASWVLFHVPFGTEVIVSRLTGGAGLSQLLTYVGIAALACVGYGAVFLLMGVAFRNPIVPAVVILVWEGMNALLPPLLKKISVIHYLESLCPVALPVEQISILADPSPASVAVPGILALALVLLAGTSFLVRRMEILYGTE